MCKYTDNEILNDINRACDVMRRGGVVLYPTDTVWGIGCDATDPEAVRRVFEIKQRSDAKALITLVDSVAMLERYVDEVPEVAYQLLDVADKPLTIVYDHGIGLAPELLASDGSVGIRLTTERYSSGLCRRMRKPVVSTSANISGNATPANFSEIDPAIIAAVDYVAEYRRDDMSGAKPSSVMKLSADGTFKILRP